MLSQFERYNILKGDLEESLSKNSKDPAKRISQCFFSSF